MLEKNLQSLNEVIIGSARSDVARRQLEESNAFSDDDGVILR